MNSEVRKYMAEIGAKGGKAGKGSEATKAKCRAAAKARWAKVRAAKKDQAKKDGNE